MCACVTIVIKEKNTLNLRRSEGEEEKGGENYVIIFQLKFQEKENSVVAVLFNARTFRKAYKKLFSCCSSDIK